MTKPPPDQPPLGVEPQTLVPIEPWYCSDCGGLQVRPSDTDICDVCLHRRSLYRGRPLALWKEQRRTRRVVRETQGELAKEQAAKIAVLWPQAQLFLSVQRQYSTYVPADWAHLTRWPWIAGMTIRTAQGLADAIAACGSQPPTGEVAMQLEAEVELEREMAEGQDPSSARLLSEAEKDLPR